MPQKNEYPFLLRHIAKQMEEHRKALMTERKHLVASTKVDLYNQTWNVVGQFDSYQRTGTSLEKMLRDLASRLERSTNTKEKKKA